MSLRIDKQMAEELTWTYRNPDARISPSRDHRDNRKGKYTRKQLVPLRHSIYPKVELLQLISIQILSTRRRRQDLNSTVI